ncbi:hypothetical protein [uncultured Dokdonia sp.]|uniref:hypothetical protein n=2 Tax=uncultured Dokdonia sp. TaxID=575653 RepID=UPI0026247760|nr:hypothetical protein [uncultured Dokdonia sp.]
MAVLRNFDECFPEGKTKWWEIPLLSTKPPLSSKILTKPWFNISFLFFAKYSLFGKLNVYAFRMGDVSITLGYLLWVIAKIQRKGAHPLGLLLEMNGKWDLANRMLEAYSEMLESEK